MGDLGFTPDEEPLGLIPAPTKRRGGLSRLLLAPTLILAGVFIVLAYWAKSSDWQGLWHEGIAWLQRRPASAPAANPKPAPQQLLAKAETSQPEAAKEPAKSTPAKVAPKVAWSDEIQREAERKRAEKEELERLKAKADEEAAKRPPPPPDPRLQGRGGNARVFVLQPPPMMEHHMRMLQQMDQFVQDGARAGGLPGPMLGRRPRPPAGAFRGQPRNFGNPFSALIPPGQPMPPGFNEMLDQMQRDFAMPAFPPQFQGIARGGPRVFVERHEGPGWRVERRVIIGGDGAGN